MKDRRSALLAERDAARAVSDKLQAEAKNLRSKVKVTNTDEIERRLRQLEDRQSTSIMTLREEKDTIKEIESLSAQRKHLQVANDAVAKSEAAREAAKKKNDELSSTINTLGEQVRAATEKLNEAFTALEALQKQRGEMRTKMTDLMKERDEAREKANEKYAALKTLKDEHYAAVRAYGEWVEEQKRQRYIKEQEERAERERKAVEAVAAAVAAGETPEATAAASGAGKAKNADPLDDELSEYHPWAETLAECDRLIAFLEHQQGQSSKARAPAASAAVTFKGIKGKEEDDEFASMRKGKAKGKQQAASEAKRAAPLSFDLAFIETLSKLDLLPPTTTSDLPTCIDAVRAKRKFYETAPPPAKAAPAAAEPSKKGFGRSGAMAASSSSEPATSGAAATAASPSLVAGAIVRTPYGSAEVQEVRGDGFVVVGLPHGTGYLQVNQITA